MYRHENPTDPLYMKIRTGFVITFENFTFTLAIKITDRYYPMYYGG